VKNFVFVKVVEAIDDFAQDLDGLLFSEILAFFDIAIKITIIAVLENEIVVVGCFLHVVQLYDIVALTALEHLYLTLQQLLEFTYLPHYLPLTPSLRMDFTAISLLVARS
jgi:hypothetical protein